MQIELITSLSSVSSLKRVGIHAMVKDLASGEGLPWVAGWDMPSL